MRDRSDAIRPKKSRTQILTAGTVQNTIKICFIQPPLKVKRGSHATTRCLSMEDNKKRMNSHMPAVYKHLERPTPFIRLLLLLFRW